MRARFVTKWLAYIDKFVLFPRRLRRRLKIGAGGGPHLRSLERDVCPADSRNPGGSYLSRSARGARRARRANRLSGEPHGEIASALDRCRTARGDGRRLCLEGDAGGRAPARRAPGWKAKAGTDLAGLELPVSKAARRTKLRRALRDFRFSSRTHRSFCTSVRTCGGRIAKASCAFLRGAKSNGTGCLFLPENRSRRRFVR